MQETQVRFLDQEETPWRRKWLSTWVFLEKYWEMPGKSHGQRSLAGYSPWGRRVRHGWATNTLLTVIAYCLLVVGGGTVRQWSTALQEGGLSGQQGGGQEYSHHIFQRPEGRNINSRTKLTQRLRKWPKQGVASELSRRQKWAKVPGKRGTLGKTLGQTKEGSSEWREIRGESHVLHTSYLLLAEIVLHARQSYSTLYVTSLRVMRGCKILVLNLGKRQLTESGAHLPAAADEPLERAKRDLSHDKARHVLSVQQAAATYRWKPQKTLGHCSVFTKSVSLWGWFSASLYPLHLSSSLISAGIITHMYSQGLQDGLLVQTALKYRGNVLSFT